MRIQKLETIGGETLVVLPQSEYEKMIEALEEREDEKSIRIFEQKLAAGAEEYIPSEMVERFIAGENPIKVWRKYRGLSIRKLADMIGLSPSFLSQIEAGKKEGAVSTYKKIAEALKVTVDDLI